MSVSSLSLRPSDLVPQESDEPRLSVHTMLIPLVQGESETPGIWESSRAHTEDKNKSCL